MGGLVLKVPVGGSIYLNDVKVTVTEANGNGSRFVVSVEPVDGGWKEVYPVREDRVTVLDSPDFQKEMPPVKLQSGPDGMRSMVKLVIDAPDEVIVLREQLYLTCKNRDGYYHFTRLAKQKIRAIFSGNAGLKDIATMVENAAKVTHPKGNRRFEGLLFQVKGQVVYDVCQYTEYHPPKASDGSVKTALYDDCPTCLGKGCGHCEDGQVLIGHTEVKEERGE